MVGRTLGSYRLDAAIGKGGMGAVYSGEHTLIGRKAAIKVLLPEFSARPDLIRRFFNEAKAAAAVRHPGITEVYDFGQDEDGTSFLVMELLEGETLRQRMKREKQLPESEALAIARQIAAALAAAHEAKIIHRDLKPSNIFLLTPEGTPRVKLMDFGVAKLQRGEDSGDELTKTGAIVGTPLFMSPEQCWGGARKVDWRSDLYSLGCILFAMLAGRPPFVPDGPGAVLAMHIYEKPPQVSEFAPVSDEVEALVGRLLSKEPDERAGDIHDVMAELLELSPSDDLSLTGRSGTSHPSLVSLSSQAMAVRVAGAAERAARAAQDAEASRAHHAASAMTVLSDSQVSLGGPTPPSQPAQRRPLSLPLTAPPSPPGPGLALATEEPSSEMLRTLPPGLGAGGDARSGRVTEAPSQWPDGTPSGEFTPAASSQLDPGRPSVAATGGLNAGSAGVAVGTSWQSPPAVDLAKGEAALGHKKRLLVIIGGAVAAVLVVVLALSVLGGDSPGAGAATGAVTPASDDIASPPAAELSPTPTAQHARASEGTNAPPSETSVTAQGNEDTQATGKTASPDQPNPDRAKGEPAVRANTSNEGESAAAESLAKDEERKPPRRGSSSDDDDLKETKATPKPKRSRKRRPPADGPKDDGGSVILDPFDK